MTEARMYKVMGLDMSTCAGLSVVSQQGNNREVNFTEVIQFKKLTDWHRVNAIVSRVMERLEEYKPDFVVLEDYAVSRFGGAAIVSIEIGSILRFCLWQKDFPFLCVSPSSLKKFVTGKGNSKKDVMMLEVFKRFGFTSESNDIADAVGLGMYGLCAIGGKFRAEDKSVVAAGVKADIAFSEWLASRPPLLL